MLKVANKKCIRNLSRKHLKAGKARKRIAIAAIALTTMLFTALFTIGMTIVTSYERQTFRQVGGDMHGTFKNITEEQLKELSSDPLIVKWGARLMLGMPTEVPFNKAHVEVSYMTETQAKGFFCEPTTGRLPKEGTMEIACDTRILDLLGVKPELGAEIKMPYVLGSNSTQPEAREDTFTLCGWWEYDSASMASMAIVPRSYAEQALATYEKSPYDDVTGSWSLNVYFKNTRHIEDDLKTVLANHGYQTDDRGKDNYINIGINWAYAGAQFAANADPGTMIAVVVILLLIIFTGYLIIYNIFQISVVNDIRFYGLIKTIGTTSKQIRTIVRRQALALSAAGIPIGLVLGYLSGTQIAPVIMSQMNGLFETTTLHPAIFIGSTLFSLFTVFISCRKPGKVAGRVSPVEAVRYTEGSGSGGAGSRRRKKPKHGQRGAKVGHMAFANLGRNRVKTVLVIISLSLAVVLMQLTYVFANGFDMDKYLRVWVVSDFIVGHADYFQTGAGFRSSDEAVPENVIDTIKAQGGITEGGRIYGCTTGAQEFVSEDWFRAAREKWSAPEFINMMLDSQERTEDGMIIDDVQLYGMEDFPLDQLKVIAGDLAPLHDPTQNAVAAVFSINDYDEVHEDSQWADVGDEITIRHVKEWEVYDNRTGEPLTEEQIDQMENDPELGQYISSRAKTYKDVTYTVAACVTVPTAMGYRYYGRDEFILNSEVFKRDTGASNVMTYIYNVDPETNGQMEAFLKDYTENENPLFDYESKQTYESEFNDFRNMFMLLGGLLSLVIGLVGVLNFFNAILTGILTRRREFALLQAVGMTNKQLSQMLIYEGLCYAGLAVAVSLILCLIMGPMLDSVLSSMFWFFTYRFSLLPVLCVAPVFVLLGVVLPFVTHRFANKQSIVDRIRAED